MTKQTTDGNETWLPIPGYEGFYEVSNFGRVRGLPREVAHAESDFLSLRGQDMALRRNTSGFLTVRLSRDGVAKDVYVERLVAELFPRDEEAELSLPGEEWKDVAGFEGLYRASNLGRIRGVGRYVAQRQGGRQLRRGRIIQGAINRMGYVQLVLCKDGGQKSREVHRLVAQAFVPNPNNLPCVNHKDADKTNNAVSNLEWCTQRENVRHAIRHKTRQTIPAETIRLVHERHANGEPAASIARSLSLPYKTVLRLTDGNEWRHVD